DELDPDAAPHRHRRGRGGRDLDQGSPRPVRRHPRGPGRRGDARLRARRPPDAAAGAGAVARACEKSLRGRYGKTWKRSHQGNLDSWGRVLGTRCWGCAATLRRDSAIAGTGGLAVGITAGGAAASAGGAAVSTSAETAGSAASSACDGVSPSPERA